ncbi:MAG: hypothetical protein ACOYL3_26370 [Desulfuromonadaceae bacterium]
MLLDVAGKKEYEALSGYGALRRATKCSPSLSMAGGRWNFYYRLNVVTIYLSPIGYQKVDILLLV